MIIRSTEIWSGNNMVMDGDVAARLVERGRAVYMDDRVLPGGRRFVLLLLPSVFAPGTTLNIHPDGVTQLVGDGDAIRLDAR